MRATCQARLLECSNGDTISLVLPVAIEAMTAVGEGTDHGPSA